MRKTFAPILVLTLLALGVAGVAWAVQAEVGAPQDPVEVAPVPGQASETSPLADGDTLGAISLEGLFQEPVEVDACCFANCRSAWNACKNACGSDQACLSLCADEYEACIATC
ncbi:MAG TPA: hypothetical protein VJG13_02765 [Thermoanaerobaculia bacterium]|nr:hypothetical protein [Thermoanaerobaculia bacterium]